MFNEQVQETEMASHPWAEGRFITVQGNKENEFFWSKTEEVCLKSIIKDYCFWDYPGGPGAKTLYSQYRGPRFNPW